MKEITYKKTYILLALFFLIGLIIIGYSYAYTHARIYNKESTSTIIANGAIMEITYNDPESGIETTPTIIANGIIPGWNASKKFTITGKNTAENLDESEKMIYKIGLVIESNTFSEGAINYMLSNDETPDNGLAVNDSRGVVAKTGTQWIGTGYFNQASLNEPAIHKYTLTISFPETDTNQSADKNKSLKLYVTIEGTQNNFAYDSWETIAENIQNENYSRYKVGDTKCISIDGLTSSSNGCENGEFLLRVANNSNYDCPVESETACGFVVEFVDIISETKMNNNATNIGGWPATAIRSYLNGVEDNGNWNRTGSIYSFLPTDLQIVISDTKVISGHGSADTGNNSNGNWESTDKLYLLSPEEVWVNCGDGKNGTYNCNTESYTTSRQLDYYGIKNVRVGYHDDAVKKYSGIAKRWWLRTPIIVGTSWVFSSVYSNGWYSSYVANNVLGASPAFRIG